MHKYLNNLISTIQSYCLAICNGKLEIRAKLRNFFSYKTYFEDVAAFADEIDLKTLKATNVPHNVIYPEMWRLFRKLVKINFIFILFNAVLQGFTYSSNINIFVEQTLLHALWRVLIYLIPFCIVLSYIWKYNLFKFGVAPNFKYGTKFCILAETLAKKIITIWIAIQSLDSVCWFITSAPNWFHGSPIPPNKYEDFFIVHAFLYLGSTIIFSIIISWLANLEIERLSLKPLSASIRNILGNNQ